MFHYTYLITDLEDFSFYVGVRTSEVEPSLDPYLGSGTLIVRKVKKYGKERFHKRVLRIYDTRAEANDAEEAHVDEAFLKLPGAMNMRVGGNKSRYGIKEGKRPRTEAQIASTKVWIEASRKANTGRVMTEEHKVASGNAWRGKKRGPQSPEHKAKISANRRDSTVSDETRERLKAATKAAWDRRRENGTNKWSKNLQGA